MPLMMVRAIVRPEKADDVLLALLDEGFPAATKASVFGRGKQQGLKIGEVVYDEIPKVMILVVSPDNNKDIILDTIIKSAQTGTNGNFGDGKIFVSAVDEMVTISTGLKETA